MGSWVGKEVPSTFWRRRRITSKRPGDDGRFILLVFLSAARDESSNSPELSLLVSFETQRWGEEVLQRLLKSGAGQF
jgi:hypothetical protein